MISTKFVDAKDPEGASQMGTSRRCKATWERKFKLPWREAGPPNHHDDEVDSD